MERRQDHVATPLTHEDIFGILGECDELVVAELLASGITPAELARVAQELEREAEAGELVGDDADPRAVSARLILCEAVASGRWLPDDDEQRA